MSEHEQAIKLANKVLDRPYGDPDDDQAVLARQFLRAVERCETYCNGLEESIKLQSHYGGLLNAYDGGKRLTFASADEWLNRLASLSKGGPRK